MGLRKCLGALLIALPFIAVTTVMIGILGVGGAVLIWGTTFVVVGCLAGGLALLSPS